MRYEEMVTRLDVTDDFCAVSESGAYCRDLYHKGGKQDCAALKVSSLQPHLLRRPGLF